MGRVLRRFFRPLAKFAVFSWDRTDASKICGRIATSFVDGEHRRRDFLYPIWLLPAIPASSRTQTASAAKSIVPFACPPPSLRPAHSTTSGGLPHRVIISAPRQSPPARNPKSRLRAEAECSSEERKRRAFIEPTRRSLNVPPPPHNRRPDSRAAAKGHFPIPQIRSH